MDQKQNGNTPFPPIQFLIGWCRHQHPIVPQQGLGSLQLLPNPYWNVDLHGLSQDLYWKKKKTASMSSWVQYLCQVVLMIEVQHRTVFYSQCWYSFTLCSTMINDVPRLGDKWINTQYKCFLSWWLLTVTYLQQDQLWVSVLNYAYWKREREIETFLTKIENNKHPWVYI